MNVTKIEEKIRKGGACIMKIVRCVKHSIEFQLPTTEEEFLLGKLHDEVLRIQSHNEDYPQCKMRVNTQK